MNKVGSFDNLRKSFLDLVDDAGKLRDKNESIKPVFSEVPTALKSFATKVTDQMSQLKARLHFEFVDDKINLRSKGLDAKDNNKTMLTITQWIVTALRHIIDTVEQQGEIITVHTEALAHPREALLVAKDEEIKDLQNEIRELTKEIDETRQRGIKGNLIISSPENGNGGTLANHITVDGKRESDTDMVIRLIKQKTGVAVNKTDVIACHPMGKKKENHSFIIRLASRQEGSSWHIITEGMRTGKNSDTKQNFTKDNIYINYQLTDKRAKLAMAVRKARTDKHIHKYYITQNGVIKVRKTADREDSYVEVTSEAHLHTIIDNS